MPPIVIAGAIAAGGALAGGALTSRAANKAAKGQEDAARQSQAFNEKVYGEQKQLMAPFVGLGTDAMKRYGDYTAQPFSARIASVGQPYSPGTAAGGPFALGPQQAPAPQGPPMGGTAAGPMPGGGGFGFGGGGVRMRNPADGSIRMVPPQLVQQMRAKGAEVVN